MTILVTGASGTIGSRLVARLAEAGHSVRATARDSGALSLPDDVETRDFDIATPDATGTALDGIDTVFLYPTLGGAEGFLDAARNAELRHVVLLSSPASFEPGEYDSPIGLAHRAMERALEESGMPCTVLYPSWLASNARRDWAGSIRAEGRIRLPYPDAQVTPIHIDDIADVAISLLTEDRFRGRSQVITGPESLRLRDIVAILAAELGQKIPVDLSTPEEALASRPEWMPESVLKTLLEVEAMSVGVPAHTNNTVERITGRPARAFGDWANANRGAFLD